MNIIYKCFIYYIFILYSTEIQTHIENREDIYFKILKTKFFEMVERLKNLKNNLYFDIYLLP